MAAIDNFQVANSSPIAGDLMAFVRKAAAEHFWSWYEQNKDDIIFKKRVLNLISISIRVKDVRFLFEKLFGPEPLSIA